MNSYNCKAWTDLKINDNKFDSNYQRFEWTVTFNVINQVKHFKCNSSRKNSFWTFAIKMLQGLLPLGLSLKQRHPTWYKDFYCTLCLDQEEETISHLQKCTGLSMLWMNLRSDLESYISTLWDLWSTDLCPLIRQKCSHFLLGNSYTSPQFVTLMENAMELKFDISVFNSLKNTLKTSSAKTRALCTKILVKFVQVFRKSIWQDRCSKVIAWERSHNISQRMKTAVNKRKNRHLNTQVTHAHMKDPEILDDPYIPPPMKPPLETKRNRFERLWKSSIPQIYLLIQKSLRYSWNFTQSKGLYMNVECPNLAEDVC